MNGMHRKHASHWVIFLAALLAWPTLRAQSSSEFGAPAGPHAVGFREVLQYDTSRSYRPGVDLVTGERVPGDNARPIQTLVWYPADAGGTAMTYGDYLALGAHEDRFDRTPDEAARVARVAATPWAVFGGLSLSARTAMEHAPVWAHRDAPPLDGRFPVVVYAPSDGSSAFENDRLCEYWASHGYVVLASPSIGAHGRYMTDDAVDEAHGDVARNLENTQAQAADIGFLIGYAGTLPHADTSRLAVAGFSWGGMASTFAAAHDSRIRALVYLDGSVRYFPKLVAAGHISPTRIDVPLIFFADTEATTPAIRKAWAASLIERARHAENYFVQMLAMQHEDFAADTQRYNPALGSATFTVDEARSGYTWMSRYSLAFLDAYLKSDAAALAFLHASPASNGVPPNVMSMSARAPLPQPPSLQDFAARLARDHFADPVTTYRAFRRDAPDVTLLDAFLSQWQTAAYAEGDAQAALGLNKLRVALYPRSAAAWLELGVAEEATGSPRAAIMDYRHALAIDGSRHFAAMRIAALSSVADEGAPAL